MIGARGLDVVIRWFPGHEWIRPFVSLTDDCEQGRGWLYGCVRRDAWRVGRVSFGLLRMPYEEHLPRELQDAHRSDR